MIAMSRLLFSAVQLIRILICGVIINRRLYYTGPVHCIIICMHMASYMYTVRCYTNCKWQYSDIPIPSRVLLGTGWTPQCGRDSPRAQTIMALALAFS